MIAKKIAVITGGAGFIGSHVADILLKNNFEVRIIDNLSGGNIKNISKHLKNKKLIFKKKNICSIKSNDKVFKNVKYIFHFAGKGDIVPSIENPYEYFNTNVLGTIKILEAAKINNIKKFIYAASSSCYGLAKTPTSEKNPIQTLYPYALSKYQGEQCVLHWGQVYNLPVISIRIFNAYGPRVKTTGAYGAVFGVFFKQKLEKKPFTIVGNGNQKRDFLYVTDVAQAFIKLAESSRKGEIYNLGAGKPQTINKLVKLLGDEYGKLFLPTRPGEPFCTWASIKKIKKHTKWKPKVDFKLGVNSMLKDINEWKDAPLWNVKSINRATKNWFKFMKKKNNLMLEKYQKKIKTVKELKKIIGKFPRTKKVIMCHGVFDVVHPGHIRHLAYAKSKADILVVSLTSDIHITKGKYRPHVPEKIRAINIATFEMVDYVLIDFNKTPNKNLLSIKPDYFAKGFEYTSNGLPPATIAENKILKSYGGSIIFTPGDIVYSSSKILDTNLPNLQVEKLISIMNEYKIDFVKLKQSLRNLNKLKVHVIGDTIIDSYTRTTMIGGQVKTPTISVLHHKREDYLGGAGIVSRHIRAAGAKVVFTTVVGNDNFKKLVKQKCKNDGILLNVIEDRSRPTTHKNTIVTDQYRLLKIDTLDNRPISEDALNVIEKKIKKHKVNAVIFSDFRHGIFNSYTIKKLTKAIPKNLFKVADSQVATRWGNICDFKNFDLITPNEREARFSLADQDSNIGKLTENLRKNSNFKNLILKLGAKGVFCVGNKNKKNEYFSIDSFVTKLVDAVGAGDALLAYGTLVYLNTKSLLLAGIIGSIAASCECEIDGNIPIKPKNIEHKIDQIEKLMGYSSSNNI